MPCMRHAVSSTCHACAMLFPAHAMHAPHCLPAHAMHVTCCFRHRTGSAGSPAEWCAFQLQCSTKWIASQSVLLSPLPDFGQTAERPGISGRCSGKQGENPAQDGDKTVKTCLCFGHSKCCVKINFMLTFIVYIYARRRHRKPGQFPGAKKRCAEPGTPVTK